MPEEPEFGDITGYRATLEDLIFSEFSSLGDEEQPSIGRQSPDQFSGGAYSICSVESEIVYDSGKRQMCIGAATGNARIVTVAAPSQKRVVDFHMKRRLVPPLVPAPYPASENEVLLSANIRTKDVAITENLNTLEYEVKGRYVFALLEGTYPVPAEGLQAPISPWTRVELSEALLAVENFKTGMF